VFASEKFAAFLADMRKRYDYIIIDTPPVLLVPDARIIGQWADAILYAVKWDSTPQGRVVEGLKAFASVNLKVTGLTMAQIDLRDMKHYGYGYGYKANEEYYQN